MRITTQMMNASAKKAGISLEGASLLNYVNGGTNNTQGLLNALNTKQVHTVNKVQHVKFEKLEQSADTLSEAIQPFICGDEEEDLTDAKTVSQLIGRYNDVVKELKKNPTSLNDFYREMLKEAATENEAVLSEIGIFVNENETLSFDEDKFKNTDVETIKKALSGNGTFCSKVAFIAGRVSENAKANTESYSTRYGADGYSYLMNSSKYDFWG